MSKQQEFVADLIDWVAEFNDDPDAILGECPRVEKGTPFATFVVLHDTEDWGFRLTVEPVGNVPGGTDA